MWMRWMLVAFGFNGLCTFGLRLLTGMGLAERYTSSYLVFWYLAGGLALLAIHWRKGEHPRRADLLTGTALGACSVGGQTCLGLALAQGLPGSIVFPIVLAGGLFIVAAAGVFVFHERIGPAGIAGIALGITSLALLSVV